MHNMNVLDATELCAKKIVQMVVACIFHHN